MNTAAEVTQSTDNELCLGPACNLQRVQEEFAAKGRARLPEFLTEESALCLYNHLLHQIAWEEYLASGGHLYRHQANTNSTEALDCAAHQKFAYQHVADGVSYCYLADRAFPEDLSGKPPGTAATSTATLQKLTTLLNTSTFRCQVASLLGVNTIAEVMLQATRFVAGHFSGLTFGPPASTRVVAEFQLGLTPEWMVEWGGMLLFESSTPFVLEGFIPAFNVLDIYLNGQPHWTSSVAPFTDVPRLAVYGRIYRS